MRRTLVSWLIMVTIAALGMTAGIRAEGESGEPAPGPWKLSALLTGAASFARYSDWQLGDVDSNAFSGIFDFSALYETDKANWENTLKLEYGVTKTKDSDAQKSSDRLLFNSIYRIKFNSPFRPYINLNAETPLTKGYLYYADPITATFDENRETEYDATKVQIANAFEPLNIAEGVGLEYSVFQAEDEARKLNFRAGAAARQLVASDYYIVSDDEATPEIEFTIVEEYNDYGFEAACDLKFIVKENVVLTSTANAFYGFDNEFVKAQWDTSLGIAISKVFGVSLNALMVYDELVIDELQWKTVTLFTLNYKLL